MNVSCLRHRSLVYRKCLAVLSLFLLSFSTYISTCTCCPQRVYDGTKLSTQQAGVRMMKHSFTNWSLILLAAGVFFGTGMEALAQQPVPWQIDQQAPASPIMEDLHDFHNMLLVIITAISLFILS